MYKLITEDTIPLIITYKFNLLEELIICSVINIIDNSYIYQYALGVDKNYKVLKCSLYNYAERVLKVHLTEKGKVYNNLV